MKMFKILHYIQSEVSFVPNRSTMQFVTSKKLKPLIMKKTKKWRLCWNDDHIIIKKNFFLGNDTFSWVTLIDWYDEVVIIMWLQLILSSHKPGLQFIRPSNKQGLQFIHDLGIGPQFTKLDEKWYLLIVHNPKIG